jgi:hypothetical protein
MIAPMENAICGLLTSYGYEEWNESPFRSSTNRVYLRCSTGHEAHVRRPSVKGDCYRTIIYYQGKAVAGNANGIAAPGVRAALKGLHPEFIPESERIHIRGDGTWRWRARSNRYAG